MDGSLLLGSVILAILAVVVFIAFYSFRLLKAGRAARESGEQFRAMLEQQAEVGRALAKEEGREEEEDGLAAGADEGGVSSGGVGVYRVYESSLGLKRFSEEPVFLRRGKDGNTIVQMAKKPPMPVHYVLDLEASKVLKEISSRATLDFGETWMILAEEDERGKLVVTHLG